MYRHKWEGIYCTVEAFPSIGSGGSNKAERYEEWYKYFWEKNEKQRLVFFGFVLTVNYIEIAAIRHAENKWYKDETYVRNTRNTRNIALSILRVYGVYKEGLSLFLTLGLCIKLNFNTDLYTIKWKKLMK